MVFSEDQLKVLQNIYQFKSIKMLGPYTYNKRTHLHINMDGKNRYRQYAAWLVEIKYGRKLKKDETVDHIDEDKTNDSMDNLQILSRRDNSLKAYRAGKSDIGLKKMFAIARSPKNSLNKMGEKNGNSKVTGGMVTKYRDLFSDSKITISQIVKETSMSRRSVIKFIEGKSYKNDKGKKSKVNTCKRYTDEDIDKAIILISSGLSVRKAAGTIGMDKSTLLYRIKKRE